MHPAYPGRWNLWRVPGNVPCHINGLDKCHSHRNFRRITSYFNSLLQEEYLTMALTKVSLVDAIAEANGFPREKASGTVETLLEIIKSTLASGEDVLISGFGKFCVKQKKQRKGRNPATGEDLILAPRKVVTFKCSGILRDKINGTR